MKHDTIIVRAEWDPDAQVWWASSTDIDGLAVEASTVDQLQTKVLAALSDLIELNGLDYDSADIPIHFLAQTTVRLANPNRH